MRMLADIESTHISDTIKNAVAKLRVGGLRVDEEITIFEELIVAADRLNAIAGTVELVASQCA